MNDIGELVGTRELTISNGGKVVVSVSIPTQSAEDGSDFRCFYNISGLRNEKNGRVIGSDAIQVLQLALIRVGAILYTSDEWAGNNLFWHDSRVLGFPLPDTLRDLEVK